MSLEQPKKERMPQSWKAYRGRVIATEHQIMRLEGAFRNRLTDFLEIDPRCDAQRLERRQEGERLSTIHIGDRTANPYREVELVVKNFYYHVSPLSCKELKNSKTRAYRSLFSAISFLPNPLVTQEWSSFTLLIEGVSVRAEVQKECGDRSLD